MLLLRRTSGLLGCSSLASTSNAAAKLSTKQSGGTVELAANTFGDPAADRKKPPLVIAHGLFGQKQNWSSVVKQLQRLLGNVVYTVDLRNHGDSPWHAEMTYNAMAADLAEFLKRKALPETGFSRALLLGHSMGGKAAMRVAARFPDLLDGLIIEDVAPRAYQARPTLDHPLHASGQDSHAHFPRYIDTMRRANLKATRQEVSRQLEQVVPELAVRQFLLTNLAYVDEREKTEFRWKLNLEAIAADLDHVLGFEPEFFVFDRPTLFVHGARSAYVQEKDKAGIQRMFPRVEFDKIPDAGHWVHAEQPHRFIQSIEGFVRRSGF